MQDNEKVEKKVLISLDEPGVSAKENQNNAVSSQHHGASTTSSVRLWLIQNTPVAHVHVHSMSGIVF